MAQIGRITPQGMVTNSPGMVGAGSGRLQRIITGQQQRAKNQWYKNVPH
jgi:hypothetical protein